jgi:hypothetical protein
VMYGLNSTKCRNLGGLLRGPNPVIDGFTLSDPTTPCSLQQVPPTMRERDRERKENPNFFFFFYKTIKKETSKDHRHFLKTNKDNKGH